MPSAEEMFAKHQTYKPRMGNGKRRVLKEFKITHVSAVDRPCQEGAVVTLIKRAPDTTGRLVILKRVSDEGTKMAHTNDLEELERQVARLEKRIKTKTRGFDSDLEDMEEDRQDAGDEDDDDGENDDVNGAAKLAKRHRFDSSPRAHVAYRS
jgi:hypothetical protein